MLWIGKYGTCEQTHNSPRTVQEFCNGRGVTSDKSPFEHVKLSPLVMAQLNKLVTKTSSIYKQKYNSIKDAVFQRGVNHKLEHCNYTRP